LYEQWGVILFWNFEVLETCIKDRERFTSLAKLKLRLMVFFSFVPIFTTAPASSKNTAQFKSGQNQLENNII
jgi:hypothetical protein